MLFSVILSEPKDPAVSDETVFATSSLDARLYAVDRTSGRQRWMLRGATTRRWQTHGNPVTVST